MSRVPVCSLRPLLLAAALLVPLLAVNAAWAHALFERSTPAPDAVLTSTPSRIHIWFSEDLSSASKIVVWDRYRHDEEIGNAVVVPGQSRQLEVAVRPLPAGSYLVLWTSVSADDGHILHGSYTFSVKHRGPLPSLAGVSVGSGGQSFPDAPTLAALLAHWLELLAAVAWVGTVAFGVFVLSGVARRIDAPLAHAEAKRRTLLIGGSLITLILASSILILLQAYGLAGNDWGSVFTRSTWSEVFSSEYGRLWIGRQALALLSLLTLLPTRKTSQHTNDAAGAGDSSLPMLLLGVLYLYLFAASGHGASAAIGTLNGRHLISISVAVDWLHFIADALWFGGQIYLVLALIPALRLRHNLTPLGAFLDALNRFSPFAYLSVGLYLVSGLFAAKVHIPSWYAFFNSIYGRTLIVKMTLIGAMMLVSVLTVYFLRPAIRRSMAGRGSSVDVRLVPRVEALLWWLRVNPVLGAGVLLATSVMFYYPVPFGFAPPPPAGYTTSAHGLTAQVKITPARAGPNQLTISLHDRRGRPVTKAGVRVLTTMLDMVMGTGVGVLSPTATPGAFRGSVDFGMGGHWRLVFLVFTPNQNLVRLPVDVRIST
jgi:copper transport protein